MIERQRQAYREEAAERLADLEQSLLLLETAPQDRDNVDRAFRDLHTIKGSGAMFGFDRIASFAHELESAFDAVREGRLAISGELISIGLGARDHLQLLLDCATEPPEALLQSGEAILERLRRVTQPAGRGAFEPGPAAAPAAPPPAAAAATDRIRFYPPPNCFVCGTNPLLLLGELRDLGTASITARTEELPPLAELDAERCYVGWDILLTTAAGEDAIRDVFIFVEDESHLTVELIAPEQSPDDGRAKAGEAPATGDNVPGHSDDSARAQPPPAGCSGGARPPAGGGIPVTPAASPPGLPEPSAAARKQPSIAAASVRVPAGKLDALINIVGEIVTLQARVNALAASAADPELVAVAEDMERLTEQLRENAMSIRMLPIGSAFERLRRLVRDLSRDLGKQAELRTAGEETELDKTVIERLADPLVHVVRNALDHGIETPAERRAAGKPETGVIRLRASHEGGSVIISVADDGRGLDRQAILDKALRNGLVSADANLTDQEVWSLILQPGFSTAREVTSVSGRGVGMDVVQRTIEELRGTLRITSEPGQGTVFRLQLPLTLAIIDGLLVKTAAHRFVLPMARVVECIELTPADRRQFRHGRVVTVRGELIGCLRLREHFELGDGAPEVEQVVITETRAGKLGVIVDRVLGDHQTVIKKVGNLYRKYDFVSGATILGDGSIALILDGDRLAAQAVDGGAAAESARLDAGMPAVQ